MRCPVCKAQVEEGPQCRRCKADLTDLFILEEQRERALIVASQWLSRGDGAEALAWAEHAAALRQDEESRRLVALAHLLRRDFGQAWCEYRRPTVK